MRLLEHQAKDLLKQKGVKVPKGKLFKNVRDLVERIKDVEFPSYLKVQVPAGARKKSGLVTLVRSEEEALEVCSRWLSEVIPQDCDPVVAEEAIDVEKEIFISVMLDTVNMRSLLLFSIEGGIDVESAWDRLLLDVDAYEDAIASRLRELGVTDQISEEVMRVTEKMVELFEEAEATLVEVNPLALTRDGRVIALDAKITLDGDALYRHPELSEIATGSPRIGGVEEGFWLIRLDGDIAVMGNGTGLTLATLDILVDSGGKPACFLDLGGGASAERVRKAVELVCELANVKAILLNVFGGITRCVDVAEGLLSSKATKPVFARLASEDSAEAKKMLSGSDIRVYGDVMEAARAAVRAVGG